jgi:hypothetical protein
LRDFWKVLQTKLFFYNLHFSFQSQHLLHPLTFSTKLLYAQTWRFVSQKKVIVSFSKAIIMNSKKVHLSKPWKTRAYFLCRKTQLTRFPFFNQMTSKNQKFETFNQVFCLLIKLSQFSYVNHCRLLVNSVVSACACLESWNV